MFTLKAGKAEQYQDIEQDETRLRVPFQILAPELDAEGEPVLDENGDPSTIVMTERIESFPLTATVAQVKETLQRHLDVYTEDYERHEATKERQAALDQSQEVAEEITGLTL